MGSLSRTHFAIFPFMSQGHTIPLLHLTRHLLHRSSAVTIFTTPGNSKLIRSHLKNTTASIIELPFPQNISEIPQGVENTSQLPSMSLLLPFLKLTKLMQANFEESLKKLNPPVSCIISDVFLGWTLESANKFSVPRYVFFGTGMFSLVLYQVLGKERPHTEVKTLDESLLFPDFPHFHVTGNEFEAPWNEIELCGPYVNFMMEQFIAMAMSHGMIANSFYELESSYIDYWNAKLGPKAHCIGPLCIESRSENAEELVTRPGYMKWLDEKLVNEESVLYVAFGTQAELSQEQLMEISMGLEKSKVNFLWVLNSCKGLVSEEFEGRVKEKGMVVNEWVNQSEVLKHKAVAGILSHCGWNSVLESISNSVPMLAMPLMAEQHLNARFVVDQIGIGMRIMPSGGSFRGLVVADEVEAKVRELMGGGEKAVQVRRKVAELRGRAEEAMNEGGSSWRALDLLIDDVHGRNM